MRRWKIHNKYSKGKKYIRSWKAICAKGNRKSKTRQGTQELKFRNRIIARSLIEEMAFELPSGSVATLSSDLCNDYPI